VTCIRVAAVADVHVGWGSGPVFAAERLADTADMLLVAGDGTRHGTLAEASVLAAEIATVPVPVVMVLGNHDYETHVADEVRGAMESARATVLDGVSTVVDLGDVRIGIAGKPGFGGNFAVRAAPSSASH
jgi:predicted phosphodiesterase